MKNRVKIVCIITILFLNFLIYLIPNNYKKEYKISKYEVTEKYLKKEKLYQFSVKNGEDIFEFNIYSNYHLKKKLINKIDKININNGYCLLLDSNKLSLYPLCIEDGKQKSYHLIEEIKDKISSKYYPKINYLNSKYKSLFISYLNNKKYLLWNYNYFYYLGNKNKTIKLFDNDYYQLRLAAQIKNYLFVPNYDDGYTFNNAYIINFNNGHKDSWNIKYDISIDSRIIGTYKKSIYLLDEKNKVLYEIVPHKKKIRKVSGRILEGSKMKRYSIDTIINKNLSFIPQSYFDYKVIDNDLYLNNKNSKVLLVKNITNVISNEKDNVYYLIDDTLYMFNPFYGSIKLITNFEWEFNIDNMIFIN